MAVWALNIAFVGRDGVSALGLAKGGAAPGSPREQEPWELRGGESGGALSPWVGGGRRRRARPWGGSPLGNFSLWGGAPFAKFSS